MGGSGEKPRERSLSAMRWMAESGTVAGEARCFGADAETGTRGVIERQWRREGKKKGLGLGKRILGFWVGLGKGIDGGFEEESIVSFG